MKSVGAFEAKTHFSQLLERVAKGEEITITRHGHPIARLVPCSQVGVDERSRAIDRLKSLSQEMKLGGLSIRKLIEEGRR